jgi:hypothetical protein
LASTGINGFMGGYEWKPENIFINKVYENGRAIEYFVSGTIEMSLLGATIIYKHKDYTGIIEL